MGSPSLGTVPRSETLGPQPTGHRTDSTSKSIHLIFICCCAQKFGQSQIRSLPYCLRLAVMLQCRWMRWVYDVSCKALKIHLNQGLAWRRYCTRVEPCPDGGCLHECGETVCNGSRSDQMFLESVLAGETVLWRILSGPRRPGLKGVSCERSCSPWRLPYPMFCHEWH